MSAFMEKRLHLMVRHWCTLLLLLMTGHGPPDSKTFTVALIAEEVRQRYKFSITPITLVISNDGKADAVWSGLLKPSDVEVASAILGL